MKLEEKRRAIEAQKKKVDQSTLGKMINHVFRHKGLHTNVLIFNLQVEAAFTRHRQKMGRTAFLNVVRRKGVTAPLSPSSGGAETPSPEPSPATLKESSQGSMERAERCKPDGAAPKSPCEDGGGELTHNNISHKIYSLNNTQQNPDGNAFFYCCGDTGVTPGEIDLAEYTRSIERLNTSLGFLQTEMQRLAQQQEKIMAMREQHQQSWVIPPPAPSPHRY